jgi:hypothetical protein
MIKSKNVFEGTSPTTSLAYDAKTNAQKIILNAATSVPMPHAALATAARGDPLGASVLTANVTNPTIGIQENTQPTAAHASFVSSSLGGTAAGSASGIKM